MKRSEQGVQRLFVCMLRSLAEARDPHAMQLTPLSLELVGRAPQVSVSAINVVALSTDQTRLAVELLASLMKGDNHD